MPRGGKRAGAGRKRESDAKRVAIQVRCAESDRDRWKAALALDERDTLSDVARDMLDAWAQRRLSRA